MRRPIFYTGSSGSPNIDLAGCVLYTPLWRPDLGGSSFRSKDLYGRDCTVTGAIWTPQGRSFDGSTGKIVHTNIPFANAEPYTLLFWSKPANISSGVYYTIYGRNESVSSAVRFNWSTPSQYRIYFFNSAGSYTTFDILDFRDSWKNYSLVASGDGTLKLYQDLSLYSGTLNSGFGFEAIGYEGGAAGNWFKGTIGEMLIYNRALSASEITNIYHSTKHAYI